jgi:group I intron endonuclease
MKQTMKERGTIYSVLCKVTNKRYIGQTVRDVNVRWKEHITDSRNHPKTLLHKAIAKYGPSMFVVRSIEEDVSINNLDEREKYWISEFDTFNNGYNLTEGGQGDSRGELSEESKDKIRQTHFGKVKSSGCIEKVIQAHKSSGNYPKNPEGGRLHAKQKVRGTNIQTGEILEFDSIKEAADAVGIKYPNICACIKGRQNHSGGYKWEKLTDKKKSYPVYGKRILDGKIIHHFNSLREASRVLGTGECSGVRKALKNPSRYSWKGCRWYYET